MGLRKRVIIAILASQTVIAVVLNVSIYWHHGVSRQHFEENVARSAASCVSHGCTSAVASSDRGFLSRFAAQAVAQHGPDCRYIVIEDGAGRVLAASSPELSAAPAGDSIARRALQAQRTVVQQIPAERRTGPYRGAALEVAAPLRQQGVRIGTLRIGFSDDCLRSAQRRTAWTGLGLTLAALLAGCVLAFLVDRRLSRSLRELIGATERITQGELDGRVTIDTGDELETLGRRFNLMADRLGQTIRALREHEEALEDRVRQRTAQLATERQKLSGIIHSIGAGLLLVDRKLRLVWSNHHVREWFDGPCPGGQTCQGMLGEACNECPARLALADGKMHRTTITLAGSHPARSYLVSATPISNKQGKVVQVLELIQDITREKETEQALLQAGRLSAIGELAAGVAHQINNPLGVISAHSERLSRRLETEGLGALCHHAEVIRKHVLRCQATTEKLLGFSRRDSDPPAELAVAPLVAEAIGFVRSAAPAPQGAIEQHGLAGLPRVMVVREGLLQILVNLLINAVDAAGPGGTVAVSGAVEQDRVVLRVSDDGPGVPAELREAVFQPFFTTKPAGKGTGLGLTLCCRISESFDGTLQLEQTAGRGACFRLGLPLAREAAHVA